MTRVIERAGLIGDIHAEDERLAAVLAFLRNEGTDAVLVVGDIVDGRGDVDRCCELLASAGALCVRGNHERWFLGPEPVRLLDATPPWSISETTRAFLAELPATRWLLTESGPLLLCHGLGTNDMDGIWPHERDAEVRDKTAFRRLHTGGQVRWVVNGHTHERMVRSIDGVTIINAGTLRTTDCPCFAIADFTGRTVQFYDVDDAGVVTTAEQFTLAA